MSSVSIVTLNKGRRAHLERLLEGLMRGPAPDECIVVEMGGDTAPLPEPGFPLRRIDLPDVGLPLAAARNAGRRAGSGEILVFLDVDCIPSADLVPALRGIVMRKDGLVCCEVRYLPADLRFDGWTERALDGVGVRHPARVFPDTGIVEAKHPGLFWSLAFATRARTFDRLRGFDEGFTGYGAEDTDLAFRAADLGIPVWLTSGPRVWHQNHASFDPPLQHFADIVGNARRFRARHGHWPMGGWLDAFADLGLIARDRSEDVIVVRPPTPAEIAGARLPPERAF